MKGFLKIVGRIIEDRPQIFVRLRLDVFMMVQSVLIFSQQKSSQSYIILMSSQCSFVHKV